MEYGHHKTLPLGVQPAIERAKEALQKEGFGVLFELDLQAKLREKLGVAFRPYVILGACNPALAYQTLQAEIDIGLLLPCNVIVYEQDGQSVVAAIDAAKLMTVVNNPQLAATAGQVDEKLRRVIDSL
ncbi:MAG: DUF302 domain-containing protein [Acidobacteria bacterium]|nr:DUF302 domain-containing protein [Acidobacteriota bacterium]